jgi:rubrerythrin
MIHILGLLTRSPKKGFDGMYRCEGCGTLMPEERFRCPACQEKTGSPAKKTSY